MELYKSKFLTIKKKNHTLIQEWTKKQLTPVVFKNEILSFLDVFEKHKPTSVLWIQDNFNLKINDDYISWLDKNILKCDHKIGIRKVAITIAKDEAIHVALVKSLNSSNSLIQPHYFININDAENYFETGYNNELYDPATINYKIVPNGETNVNHALSLQVGHNDLAQTLNALNLLKDNKIFAKNNKIKFELLTLKELEIFKLIVLGNTNKTIGVILFIEPSTVATHRKHILKKLEANSYKDLYKYAKAFRIVRF